MLKIGMIGAGFVARFHERALRSVRNVEFAGVYALQGAEALAQVARQDRLGDTREYGRFITMLIMAAYLSHEKRKVIDMTDPRTLAELENYVPLIQQGKGKQVL
jgi:ornithine cyclodeaminase/alanine dehydrogenase-like protein (mu-crystallin family)